MEHSISRPPFRKAGILFLACAAALTAGCESHQKQGGPGGPGGKMPPAQVAVYTVQPQALPVTTELPGRTSAYQIAEVRPQVSGIVQKRLFTEGADVAAGTQLYQIDPATYQATYNSAKAALARAQANLLTAGPKVKRYKELVEIEGVSRQDYDDAVAAEAQARADVESAKAALTFASLDTWTRSMNVWALVTTGIPRTVVVLTSTPRCAIARRPRAFAPGGSPRSSHGWGIAAC